MISTSNKMFRIIALVGHSGSGKTTIQETALKLGINLLGGMKTRPYRSGESRRDYECVSPAYFLTEHEKGKIYCETIYRGNLYGVHKDEIEPKRLNIVTLTPDGLENLKGRFKKEHIVSIYVESTEAQRRQRMSGRGDDEKSINKRIEEDRKIFSNAFSVTDYKITSDTPEADILEFLDILREIREDAIIF
jgi:guanylate kinase